MRRSNRGTHPGLAETLLAALLAAAVMACGGSSATPSPRASSGPLITPDPHLKEPVVLRDLYLMLGAAGIHITANTATKGPNGEPVSQITGTYANWPIVLSAYSSSAALRSATKFDPVRPPGFNEPPYSVVGLNIIIEFGPRITNGSSPAPPDATKVGAMTKLVAVLDPLLGPLAQRSVQPLALPKGTPLPGSSAAPSAAPSASRAASPSAKP